MRSQMRSLKSQVEKLESGRFKKVSCGRSLSERRCRWQARTWQLPGSAGRVLCCSLRPDIHGTEKSVAPHMQAAASTPPATSVDIVEASAGERCCGDADGASWACIRPGWYRWKALQAD